MAKKSKLQPKPTAAVQEKPKAIVATSIRVPARIANYVIYPSAARLAKAYVNRARRAGLVKDPSEFALGLGAMLAAGICKAEESQLKFVTPEHIKRGWSERLSVGGGNCPPHKCIARSVLNKADELRQSLPFFDDLFKL